MASLVADDASMPSIRRLKRRAGGRLLMTPWTTLLLLFSHVMKALLLLFSLVQHLGLFRILISDCAKEVLQRLRLYRIHTSVCAKKFLQQLGDLRTLVSICAKKGLHLGRLSIRAKKILQHLELLLISICSKKVLPHLGLLRILISVCAHKVLRRLRLLRNLISVCEMKVLQIVGLLLILLSVCAQTVLQHKLGDLGLLIPICAKRVLQHFGLLIPICAKKVLQQVGDLRTLKSTCAKIVFQHLWLLRIIRSICGEKAICFLLYYIVVPPNQSGTLLPEVIGVILEHVNYEQVFQLKLLSKGWKLLIESGELNSVLSSKKQPSFTACYFIIKDGVGELAGFDPNWRTETSVGKWRKLPPLTFLPTDCDLSKQFLICAKNGLVCMNFSESERLIVFNPLTQILRELPPLLNRRNPVLMHMIVDESTHSYQILAAGSSSEDREHDLSKITELYDSGTQQWTKVGDLPGPAFALNEFQAGVYLNDNIFCIGFMKHNNEVVKGILGFNMVERTWSTSSGLPNSSSILQLVENDGQLYLFSEHTADYGEFYDQCVDRVEWSQTDKSIPFKLVNVIKTRKTGGWSLDVFPEYALLPYSKSQLCIYNTVDHTGEIYDVEDRERFEVLQAIPEHGEVRVCTLNHMSFTLEPRFSTRA